MDFYVEAANAGLAEINSLKAQLNSWKCAARKSKADPPQDCDWPNCGCDPHAQRVIEGLLECGWIGPHEADLFRDGIRVAQARESRLRAVVEAARLVVANNGQYGVPALKQKLSALDTEGKTT